MLDKVPDPLRKEREEVLSRKFSVFFYLHFEGERTF